MDHIETPLSDSEVATKFSVASDIMNAVLAQVVEACVAGAKLIDLCTLGDKLIEDGFNKVYTKNVDGRPVLRGIAFPTCITINELCGGLSPLASQETAQIALKEGDMVKIDMGGHIDGYPSIIGHTLVVGSATTSGRKADAIKCLNTILDAIPRLCKPGNTNRQVTNAIKAICAEFDCQPVGSIFSHEMLQHTLDGHNTIFPREATGDERFPEFAFTVNTVFGIDIGVSTGTGKLRDTEIKPTVYKRDLTRDAELRTQAGRTFMHQVNTRFPSMAFTLRAFDERVGQVGIAEGTRANLFDVFQVSSERQGEFVAQAKRTMFVLSSQTKYVTGQNLSHPTCETDKEVQSEEIKAILATSTKNKKKKSKAE